MSNLFNDRKTRSTSSDYSHTGRESNKSRGGVYYTSQMQGILTVKEENEKKAANIVAEYLGSVAENTYDVSKVTSTLDTMLKGFTLEEQNRILKMAFALSLTRIS